MNGERASLLMTWKAVPGVVLLGCLAAEPALASAFALREGSPDEMATAFAGNVAKAYNAASAWTNPAGMIRLGRSEVSAAANGLFPSSTFRGNNVSSMGANTAGTQGGNLTQAAAAGAAFGVWSYSPDLKFGLAAVSPFGQRVSNPPDFVGRYQSMVSSISNVAVSASAAYRINDRLSVGGGPVVDYLSARLTQAVNTGPTARLTGDPSIDLHGSDVGVGYNLGALYQFTPALRIGIDYHSRIEHTINGSQSVFVPSSIQASSPVTARTLAALNTNASAKITLPDSLVGGIYWQVDQRWAVMADLQLTRWSVLKTFTVVPSTPSVPGTTLREDWHDTWSVSIGTNYQFSDDLLLQCGVGFDESPVGNSNRTSRIPDSNRYLLGLGLQYRVLPDVTLQAAYTHVFFAAAPVNNVSSAMSGALIGKYGNSADAASVGVSYRF